jgi:2-amino-4-hydroxy-6-hydroxymethyldihydropteridine diphosphokinase
MASLWSPAYVAVGSNLNQPKARVLEAFERLETVPAIRCLRRSRLYRTRPMGPQDQPDFVNAAAGFLTQLTARELLACLLDEPGLTVPHPGVSTRNFVLYPLADIAPTLAIPGHGTVLELLHRAGEDGISVLEEHENF